jgi:hypothetical protein
VNSCAPFGAEDRDVAPSSAQSVHDLFLWSFARRILENLGLVQRLMQSYAQAERLGSYRLKWLKRFWLPTRPRDQLDRGIWMRN